MANSNGKRDGNGHDNPNREVPRFAVKSTGPWFIREFPLFHSASFLRRFALSVCAFVRTDG